MTENRVVFTKEMKRTHTILFPDMLPIHFKLLETIFRDFGYNVVCLQNRGQNIPQLGLKYVHNDTCYPALLVIGQMIDALESGKYDRDRVALMITQTGGGCRASNYIHLLRKALVKAGYGHVPVISLNVSGLEKNPGFTLPLPLVRRLVAALVYGDTLMLLSNQVRPYEKTPGQADELTEEWTERLCEFFRHGRALGLRRFRATLEEIARSFTCVRTERRPRIKVGVVGEIYMKYSPLGNNDLEKFLASQGCEVYVPGVIGFAMYCMYNIVNDRTLYGGSAIAAIVAGRALAYLAKVEGIMAESVEKAGLRPPCLFYDTLEKTEGVIGTGCKMGEGWLLTAEMLQMAEKGFKNIVCTQPFGCLPNHIIGRGMSKRVKEMSPGVNIVAIDYDPGAARVNQENRIKLMLASAAEEVSAGRENAPEAESKKEKSLAKII